MAAHWQRRARPLLGTLVEIGVHVGEDDAPGFAAIEAVQARLSRFVPDSDVARFAALPVGAALDLHPDTAELFAHAAELQARSGGAFDVTLGSGPRGWCLEGRRLRKLHAGVSFDLGGIGKGHAVDRAVAALQAAGHVAGWVNAGGDLRVFGDLELPVRLRDESQGGAAAFVHLGDGALATSRYAEDSRCQLHGPTVHGHVSVAAPSCRSADALTKLAALHGPSAGSAGGWWAQLLDDAQATVWWH